MRGAFAISTQSQKKASAAHRRRVASKGLVRVEVQASKEDAALIRAIAQTLRDEPERAGKVRAAVEQAIDGSQATTAFDIFGSDLPDEAFAGVFDLPRAAGWREVDL